MVLSCAFKVKKYKKFQKGINFYLCKDVCIRKEFCKTVKLVKGRVYSSDSSVL